MGAGMKQKLQLYAAGHMAVSSRHTRVRRLGASPAHQAEKLDLYRCHLKIPDPALTSCLHQ
jgi:hypothetical protein